MRFIASLTAIAIAGASASAAVVNESFESGTFATGWSHDSKTSIVDRQLDYSSGTISIDGGDKAVQYLATNSGSGDLAFLDVEFSPTALPVYYSFLIQTTTGGGGTPDFLGAYPDNTISSDEETANNYGIVLRANDTTTNFGVRSNEGGTQTFVESVDVANGETHLVVVKVEYINAKITLWVDPDSGDENSASNLSRSALDTDGSNFEQTTMNRLAFRTALLETGDTYFVDQVVVADSFAEAVHVPEPGTMALIGAGTTCLLWRRSKRRARARD